MLSCSPLDVGRSARIHRHRWNARTPAWFTSTNGRLVAEAPQVDPPVSLGLPGLWLPRALCDVCLTLLCFTSIVSKESTKGPHPSAMATGLLGTSTCPTPRETGLLLKGQVGQLRTRRSASQACVKKGLKQEGEGMPSSHRLSASRGSRRHHLDLALFSLRIFYQWRRNTST